MHVLLRNPSYTERLASFLRSVGQSPVVAGMDSIELPNAASSDEEVRLELELYLRVWNVLYPEAEVELAVC
jgi:hypothetical protein